MLGLKKGFAAALVAALLVIGGTGNALAASYIPTVTTDGRGMSLATSYNFAGDTSPYYVTPLGFDSTIMLRMIDQTTPYPYETLFTNQDLATEFGQSKRVEHLQDLLIVTPNNSCYGFVYGNSDYKRELLLDPITFSGKLTLPVGAIIIAMGVHGQQTGDFNDFIFAISKTAPLGSTPIPGAVWLLGSGLLGLAGFKRARKGV